MRLSTIIKPTQPVPIAYYGENGLTASNARWWFTPHWHKGEVKGWKATTFNAKIETAHEKPTFRTYLQFGKHLKFSPTFGKHLEINSLALSNGNPPIFNGARL